MPHALLGGTASELGWALGEAVSLDLQEGCNAGYLRPTFAPLFAEAATMAADLCADVSPK